MKRFSALSLMAVLLLLGLTPVAVRAQQETFQFDYTYQGVEYQFSYLLFLPSGYDPEGAEQWPLIFFHHGSGENGDNIERVKVHGPPRIVEEDADFPFVVLAPQIPSDPPWEAIVNGAWMGLLDQVQATHAIDADRVYLTGLSQGGFISWLLGVQFPERFAAVVPIAGGLDVEDEVACRLQGVPVWAFHGDRDAAVPPSASQVLVDALEECGGNIRFTLYEGVGHVGAWQRAYGDPGLYDWLLQQSLADRATLVRASTWGALKGIFGVGGE
ncbi:MAG: prolyl oligopeptidase family serine peptidase [Candidatus Latescibacteria bacterium]|nr:prolyl oligopeptidase family serine peptidase [Candidatus Latescibacterota bacterium]